MSEDIKNEFLENVKKYINSEKPSKEKFDLNLNLPKKQEFWVMEELLSDINLMHKRKKVISLSSEKGWRYKGKFNKGKFILSLTDYYNPETVNNSVVGWVHPLSLEMVLNNKDVKSQEGREKVESFVSAIGKYSRQNMENDERGLIRLNLGPRIDFSEKIAVFLQKKLGYSSDNFSKKIAEDFGTQKIKEKSKYIKGKIKFSVPRLERDELANILSTYASQKLMSRSEIQTKKRRYLTDTDLYYSNLSDSKVGISLKVDNSNCGYSLKSHIYLKFKTSKSPHRNEGLLEAYQLADSFIKNSKSDSDARENLA